MATNRINRALAPLARLGVDDVPRGETRFVCKATQAEWDAFLASEDQVIKSTHLEWFADTNEIHIVEFPGKAHEKYVCALMLEFASQRAVKRHLAPSGASHNDQGPRREPDLSYGPIRDATQPLGAVLPANVADWGEFLTLKVEVGVSRGWGMGPGLLDWKALIVWTTVPGVEYVLCIATDERLQNATYKLYDLTQPHVVQVPKPLNAVQRVVQFDAWRLLGIDPTVAGNQLPRRFPNPVEVDMFDALLEARRWGETPTESAARSIFQQTFLTTRWNTLRYSFNFNESMLGIHAMRV